MALSEFKGHSGDWKDHLIHTHMGMFHDVWFITLHYHDNVFSVNCCRASMMLARTVLSKLTLKDEVEIVLRELEELALYLTLWSIDVDYDN